MLWQPKKLKSHNHFSKHVLWQNRYTLQDAAFDLGLQHLFEGEQTHHNMKLPTCNPSKYIMNDPIFVWFDSLCPSVGGSSSTKQRIKHQLTLKELIATKVVCFSRLLKCLSSLYSKQCGPSVDPDQTAPIGAVCSGSYRSSLFWVHAVCFYT